ncbi:hypothetical protein IJH89_02520 [Candidatus Saccharibacteria bacterium]|nr:hypothetical protein [Candidatus Saccharibacteria bacterium]
MSEGADGFYSARARIFRLKSLVRAAMKDGMRIFTYESKNRAVPLVLAGLAFLSIFGYAMTTTTALKASGEEVMILAIFTFVTALLTLSEGIYKSGSLLFECRDNDMLMAMPLSRREIVFLRLFKFYVFELVYNSLFLGPAILAYVLQVPVGVEFYVVSAVMLIFLPVIPVGVAAGIGAGTAALSTKFKKKNAMQILFTLLFLILVVVASSQAARFGENEGGATALAGAAVARVYYPARTFVRLATEFNIAELVGFVLVNVGVAAVAVFGIGRGYFWIVSRVGEGSPVESGRGKLKFERKGVGLALELKEIRKYFSTPVLVSNTGFGMVLFLIGVGVVCLKFEEIATKLIEGGFLFSIEEIEGMMPIVAFCMVAFSSLLTFISATMLSLERREFNLLKVFPVSAKRVLFSKVFAAMMLTVPVLVVGAGVMMIRFKFSLIEAVLVFVGAVLFPFVTEMIGILVDLKFARFNMGSDAEIVKQSPGIMVMSFLGLFLTIATVSFSVGVAILFGAEVGMAATVGVYLVFMGGLIIAVEKIGERRFRELSA